MIGCGANSDETPSKNLVLAVDGPLKSMDSRLAAVENQHGSLQKDFNFFHDNFSRLLERIAMYGDDPYYTRFEEEVSESYLNAIEGNTDSLFFNAKMAHQTTFEEFNSRYTKLKATIRLYNYQNPIEVQKMSAKSAGSVIELLNSLYDLKSIISKELYNHLIAAIQYGIDWLALSIVLKEIYDYLKDLENLGTFSATISTAMVLLMSYIEINIDTIIESALELNMEGTITILKSLINLTGAVLLIMGLDAIKNSFTESDTATAKSIKAYSTSTKINKTASTVFMRTSTLLVGKSIEELQNAARDSSNNSVDYSSVSRKLKLNSEALILTVTAMKSLFEKLFEAADLNRMEQASFQTDSTADQYKKLFTSTINPYDTSLSKTVSSSPRLPSGTLAGYFTSIGSEVSSIESDAYDFATLLAGYGYDFSSQLAEDAAEFATHLADLAYEFTIDIEQDAFEFAMQGMEYGYLFASMGEEVGVMADRILWMAVQIGIMADRIGEMADRIVYTEQLIVYTEILIVDFGILIYGFGKNLINMVLTGMALIMDREWYTPETEDYILESINTNIVQMLEQMHEYSLEVLSHQSELRELTLASLEKYAQTDGTNEADDNAAL